MTEVSPGIVRFEVPGPEGNNVRAVRVDAKTIVFTVYGGSVLHDELAPGQWARVWFTTPKPRRVPPTAAVIMLESTDPR